MEQGDFFCMVPENAEILLGRECRAREARIPNQGMKKQAAHAQRKGRTWPASLQKSIKTILIGNSLYKVKLLGLGFANAPS
eukprot:1140892-Pelagomonas_calceolata.AAC.2